MEISRRSILGKEQAAEQVERDLGRMSRERLLPEEKTLEKVARYDNPAAGYWCGDGTAETVPDPASHGRVGAHLRLRPAFTRAGRMNEAPRHPARDEGRVSPWFASLAYAFTASLLTVVGLCLRLASRDPETPPGVAVLVDLGLGLVAVVAFVLGLRVLVSVTF